MYNSLNEFALEYMRNLFTRCSESNGRVLRSTDTDLKLPLLKTTAGQKSFSYRGARLRNSLRREPKVAPSLSAIRRLSKDNINAMSQSKCFVLPRFLFSALGLLSYIIFLNLFLTRQFRK